MTCNTKTIGLALLTACLLALAFSCGCTGTTTDTGSVDSGARTVTDMRGRAVELPATIERVVAIDDGFVEGLLYRFGMQDRIVGLGGTWVQDYTYPFEGAGGATYEYRNGTNPVSYLIPGLADLPVLVETGTAINYETLASLDPDVVILREGAWAFSAGSDETLGKTIATIDSLGIPLVILVGPPTEAAHEEADDEGVDAAIKAALADQNVAKAAKAVAKRFGLDRHDVYARALAIKETL